MSGKNENSKGKTVVNDPLDELNELDEKVPTIEPENDIFEELEIRDAESIPEYDGDSGILKKPDPIDAIIDEKEKTKKAQEAKKQESELNQMKEVIDELESKEDAEEEMEVVPEVKEDKVDKKASDKKVEEKTSNNIKEDSSSSKKQNSSKKAKRVVPKPKIKTKKKKSDVKKIDNVKVDEDGVPLLNQFDTDKIKNHSFFNNLHFSRRNMTQILMIIVGFIILIYGVLESFNDMVKISDNVIYGEHASMAIVIMFIGVLIIILSFYKEIISLLGLGGLYGSMDSSEGDTIDEYNDDK